MVKPTRGGGTQMVFWSRVVIKVWMGGRWTMPARLGQRVRGGPLKVLSGGW